MSTSAQPKSDPAAALRRFTHRENCAVVAETRRNPQTGAGEDSPPFQNRTGIAAYRGEYPKNYILREMPRLSRNQRKKDENRRIKKEREPQPARGEPARTVTLKAQRNGKAILARCRSGCNTQPAGAGGFIFNGQRTGKAGNPQPD